MIAGPARASSGSIDPDFGNGGEAQAQAPLEGGTTVLRGGIFQQSDGRFVAAGTYSYPNTPDSFRPSATVLTRFTRSGKADPSYGDDGWQIDGRFETTGRPVAGPADTLLLPAGGMETGGTSSAWVARYTVDGDRDTRFADGGALKLDLPKAGFWWARYIAVDRDGSMFVAFQGQGNLTDDSRMRYGIAHLDGKGQPDPDWGDHGYVISSGDGGELPGPLVVTADGGVVIATVAQHNTVGHFQNGVTYSGSVDDVVLKRYTADGRIDSGFGRDGSVDTGIAGEPGDLIADRKGNLTLAAPTDQNMFVHQEEVARFDANGSPAAGFGQQGVFKIGIDSAADPAALATQTDGKLVVAGGFYPPFPDPYHPSQNGWTLFRLLPTGKLDRSFGDRGVVTSARGPAFTAANDVEVQDDGAIVAAGTATDCDGATSFTLIRFLGDDDGKPDPGPLVSTCPGTLPADDTTIEITIACPLVEDECDGTVAVDVPVAAKPLRAGKARFAVLGNKAVKRTVKLSRAARAYVGAHPRFKALVTITARDADGHRRIVKRRMNVAR